MVIPILPPGTNHEYTIVVDPCSHLVHLGEEKGRQKTGDFDLYSEANLETIKLRPHEAFVFLASCGHAGGIPSRQCNIPFYGDRSPEAAQVSRMFGFATEGIQNYADFSVHLDIQDMLHPVAYASILKSNSVLQRTLHPCDDVSRIEAKSQQVKRHRQMLLKDMAANPTTIEGCSEYAGSCFKPHFIVESQIEIDRLCDVLTNSPSSRWAEALGQYTGAAFSDNFGERHLEGLEQQRPRKSIRLRY